MLISFGGRKAEIVGSVALWDLSYAKVLYDSNGEIKKLISDKLMNKPEPLQAG